MIENAEYKTQMNGVYSVTDNKLICQINTVIFGSYGFWPYGFWMSPFQNISGSVQIDSQLIQSDDICLFLLHNDNN